MEKYFKWPWPSTLLYLCDAQLHLCTKESTVRPIPINRKVHSHVQHPLEWAKDMRLWVSWQCWTWEECECVTWGSSGLWPAHHAEMWGSQWGSARLLTRAARKHSALGFKTIVTLRRLSSLVCFDIEVGEGLWCQVFHAWRHLWIQCTRHSCIFGTACLSCFVWWHNIIIHPDVACYI